MKNHVQTSLALIGAAFLASTLSSRAQNADTIYTNGKIYTVNEAKPWAEAVAIKDGKFVAVGSKADVVKHKGDATKHIDLGGKFVMPGLVDTHTHPFDSSFQILDQLVLDDPKSVEDIQKQVKAYADAHPEKKWITGLAWPKGMFEGENPHRSLLDKVVPDRPIALMDQGGHANWCNTKALEITGIMDPKFKVPEFGVVERDENGVPTGTIRETTIGHLKSFVPKTDPELYEKAIDYVQDLFLSKGVTAHRTAEGDVNDLIALKAKADKGEIKLHWAVGMNVNFAQSIYSFDERMEQIEGRKQYESEFVKADFAKIFLDADVSGYGIWMLEPFPGTDGNHGVPVITVENLNRWTTELDQMGISVQYHAIGSRSIEAVADAFEVAAKANGGKLKTRHYPDHMGFPTKRDLKRLTRLNGLIGYAPYFGFQFPGIHDSYAEFLGEEALGTIQPARDTIDGGAIIGTGTDFSSLPQDPWPLLEGMVHRRNPWVPASDSKPNNAAQAITVEEAIKVYTLWGAHALLAEDRIGSIEVGKCADFVVLDKNLFEIPVDDISEVTVLKTVFDGKSVHRGGPDTLDVDQIEITNAELKNAVDSAKLKLLVADELSFGQRSCCGLPLEFAPGAESAPDEVNRAFASLSLRGYDFARPARKIHWEKDNTDYWVQWTVKDDETALWAYDPVDKKVVQVLRVKEKLPSN